MSDNTKLVKKPLKTAIITTFVILLIALAVMVILGAEKFRTRILDNRREKQAERYALQKTTVTSKKPKPPLKYEFLLHPGETRTIKTHGAGVENIFSGTSEVWLWFGKYAKKEHLVRNGSWELTVNSATMDQVEAITYRRPYNCREPLGYVVKVFHE